MNIAVVTSTGQWSCMLKKNPLMNEGLRSGNKERFFGWTVRITVKIEPFCKIVYQQPLLIGTKTDISTVELKVRTAKDLEELNTHILDFSTFDQLSSPVAATLDILLTM